MKGMRIEVYLKNKIKRQILWNGREFTFVRYKPDMYHQLTNEIDEEFTFNGFFHQAGGYGGMLNIEMYEREGSRSLTKLKPMILCLYEDGVKLQMDDRVKIGDEEFKVIEKSDVQNLNVAFEISLERIEVV